MRRIGRIAVALILVLTLSACSMVGKITGSDSGQENAAPSGDVEMPALAKLLIGTLELEKGELAIDSEQAVELLPLWKMARNLSSSDSAASGEVEAVTEQIAETMTPGQLAAIDTMDISGPGVMEIMRDLGIQMGAGGARGDLSPEEIEALRAQRGQGGGGHVPGMGGGAGGGGMPGGAPGGVPGNDRAQRAGLGVPPALLDALIKLLTERAASAT